MSGHFTLSKAVGQALPLEHDGKTIYGTIMRADPDAIGGYSKVYFLAVFGPEFEIGTKYKAVFGVERVDFSVMKTTSLEDGETEVCGFAEPPRRFIYN